jgi:predicted nuclease of predicted toxin-antitoxin system
MKIKLDENMPTRLAPLLREYGHEVDTVPEEHLSGASDQRVWLAAALESRFLITQDLDFSDSRRFTAVPIPDFCSCGYASRAPLP